MKKTNILIFPAGSENALEIYSALKYNLHFELFGATSKSDYAEMLFPKERFFRGDLYVSDPKFIDKFNAVLDRFHINWIIPTHDTIALYLEERKDLLKAGLICSNKEAAYIARNKKIMFELLQNEPFVPKVYLAPYEDISFPVFIKPNIGEGAKGTRLIKTAEEFNSVKDNLEDMLVCEYLPGREYTVDCFTDRHGKVLFVGPRTRERIGMGITFRSYRVKLTKEIQSIAETISIRFSLRGAWFFQIKEDVNGNLKLMEFSVRMAGTMGFYRHLGVNFPALSLFDAMDMDVSILFSDYSLHIERCIKTAFHLEYEYDTLYVDYDDTLVVKGTVNTTLLKLIYQCVQQGKKVVLLTKHEGNLDESLSRYRLSRTLFDDIIHLAPTTSKVDYIQKTRSVLIDNYFVERKQVRDRLGIPVFDVDAAECLVTESLI